jgi:hypothetical protein
MRPTVSFAELVALAINSAGTPVTRALRNSAASSLRRHHEIDLAR